MNQERMMKILLNPIVSEKCSQLAENNNQIGFRVIPDATKSEIKQAVEKLFDVEVESVQVCNIKGKTKFFNQRLGKRADKKKAYVRLKEGHDINFVGSEG